MGNQFGVAGKSTREGGQKKRKKAVLIAVAACATVLLGLFIIIDAKGLGIGAGAILLISLSMWLIPDIIDKPLTKALKQEKQYNRGAVGEEQVGQLLGQLSNRDFVIMHDVVSPYGNIDHIVYDKRGNIFMLETKSHFGRVTAQGDQLRRDGHPFEKNIINQSLSNSIWLKEKIEASLGVKAWITPVLVFTNAFVEFGKPIKGVYYMNKKYLMEFLQKTNASSPAGLKLWKMREKGGKQ